jgi:hypothetical protein
VTASSVCRRKATTIAAAPIDVEADAIGGVVLVLSLLMDKLLDDERHASRRTLMITVGDHRRAKAIVVWTYFGKGEISPMSYEELDDAAAPVYEGI